MKRRRWALAAIIACLANHAVADEFRTSAVTVLRTDRRAAQDQLRSEIYCSPRNGGSTDV